MVPVLSVSQSDYGPLKPFRPCPCPGRCSCGWLVIHDGDPIESNRIGKRYDNTRSPRKMMPQQTVRLVCYAPHFHSALGWRVVGGYRRSFPAKIQFPLLNHHLQSGGTTIIISDTKARQEYRSLRYAQREVRGGERDQSCQQQSFTSSSFVVVSSNVHGKTVDFRRKMRRQLTSTTNEQPRIRSASP